MDGGENLVHPVHFLKGCPASGERDRANPAVFSVERSSTAAEEDAFIVARCSYKHCGGFPQMFSPLFQKILNILCRDVAGVQESAAIIWFLTQNLTVTVKTFPQRSNAR